MTLSKSETILVAGLILLFLCLSPKSSAEPVSEEAEGFKTIATPEEKMRTFESVAEEDGTLLVWGSFSNLYAAQIDRSGQVLMPTKKISSSDDRITGIAKPIRWQGDWLIAIRETDLQNKDQIRLIQMDEAGEIVQDFVWLNNFERISLPVLLKEGKNLKAAYFASQPQNASLFLAVLNNLKKIPDAAQLGSFEGGVAYPPILEGAVYDDTFALLLYYRSKKQPPMKFFLVDQNSGAVLKDADIAHEGEAFRLSDPVFQIVNDEVRIAWFESISKKIPARLIELAFTRAGEISRKMTTFSSPDIPSLYLSWVDGLLSGVFSRDIYLENKPVFLHALLPDTDPPSLQQTFIKPHFPENKSFASSKLLQLDRVNKSGVMLAGNRLFYFSYSETEEKEKDLGRAPENLFQHFKECVGSKESNKQCLTQAGEDWLKEYLLKPFLNRYEKKYY